jgi:spore germination cell wall hydrolase CwlJ-like protein
MITPLVCVAVAVYFEARGEPTAGQVAVAHVIRNRIEDPRYPDNACDVVKQGS